MARMLPFHEERVIKARLFPRMENCCIEMTMKLKAL
jgi:hypothetical protein